MTIDLTFPWRYKGLLVFGCMVGMASSIAYIALVPPTYEAVSRIQIERSNQEPAAGMLFVQTQAEIIRSPAIVEQALVATPISPPPGVPLEGFNPVRHVLKDLEVQPVAYSDVVAVRYRGHRVQEVLELTTSMIAAYESQVNAAVEPTPVEAPNPTWNILTERERTLREELAIAKERLQRLSTPVHTPQVAATPIIDHRLIALEEQLSDVRELRTELTARLATFHTAKPTAQHVSDDERERLVSLKPTLGTVSASSAESVGQVLRLATGETARALRDLDERLRQAQLSVTQLDKIYGEKHPDLIRARAEVTEYQNRLKQRVAQTLVGWQRELQDAVNHETELSAEVEQRRLKPPVPAPPSSAPIDNTEQQQLQAAKVRRLEEQHAAAAAKLETAEPVLSSFTPGQPAVTVHVIEAPTIQTDRIWPEPKIVIPIGAACGLLGGVFLALLFRSPRNN